MSEKKDTRQVKDRSDPPVPPSSAHKQPPEARDTCKARDGNLNVFLANDLFPDALAVFAHRVRPLAEIKKDCLIVLDTNALLVPYGVSQEGLEQIRKTYTKLIESRQLKIPGQVAREFAKNRATKLGELYQTIQLKQNIASINALNYTILESVPEYETVKKLELDINKMLTEYRRQVGNLLERVLSWSWDDPVSLMYASLMKEEVICDFLLDEPTRTRMQENLEHRTSYNIPPGFKDAQKPDGGIGDLLIWETILDLGQKTGKSVLFVSGEEKSDWWHRSQGRALYPRFELVEEFRRRSQGHSFHIIKLSRLLDLYGATEEAVREVKQEEIQARSEPTPVRSASPDQDDDRRPSFSSTRDVHGKLVRWLARWKSSRQRVSIISASDSQIDYQLVDSRGRATAVIALLIREVQRATIARALRAARVFAERHEAVLVVMVCFDDRAAETVVRGFFRVLRGKRTRQLEAGRASAPRL